MLHGGRGSGKSHNVGRLLIGEAASEKHRILCTRQFQSSIADSVHKLLCEQIDTMGLAHRFKITDKSITVPSTGSEFIFKGLQRNIGEVKSTEGITRCWVEEAEPVPKDSWRILRPTIRAPGSEIWITFNPDAADSATYRDFVVSPPDDCITERVNWTDNPWFPAELNAERLSDLKNDADAYEWIWGGNCRQVTDAIIFRRRVLFQDFDEPADVRPFYGLDFGYADDPVAFIRSYIEDETLYITHEAFGLHVELDDIPDLIFRRVPGSEDWPIKADAAQPAMISYLARRGFNVTGADKWPGSVEDGIAHLKAFKHIVVHPRCKAISRELRLYSYKVDPKQLDERGQPMVLPIIVDKHNHGIDALRYSLDGYIQARGGMGVWARLAG